MIDGIEGIFVRIRALGALRALRSLRPLGEPAEHGGLLVRGGVYIFHLTFSFV